MGFLRCRCGHLLDEQHELDRGIFYRTGASAQESARALGQLLLELVEASKDGSLESYLAARVPRGDRSEPVALGQALDALAERHTIRDRLEGFFCPSCDRLLMEDPDCRDNFVAFVPDPSDEDG